MLNHGKEKNWRDLKQRKREWEQDKKKGEWILRENHKGRRKQIRKSGKQRWEWERTGRKGKEKI